MCVCVCVCVRVCVCVCVYVMRELEKNDGMPVLSCMHLFLPLFFPLLYKK